jgi:hypothetical protein
MEKKIVLQPSNNGKQKRGKKTLTNCFRLEGENEVKAKKS